MLFHLIQRVCKSQEYSSNTMDGTISMKYLREKKNVFKNFTYLIAIIVRWESREHALIFCVKNEFYFI